MSPKTIRNTLVCVFAMGFANAVHALDGDFFVRGEIGQADSDFDFASAIDENDDDGLYAVRAGYYFTPNVAVEAFYARLYDQRVIEIPFGQFSLDAEVSAVGVGVIGKKRFGEDRGFFIQGRGGIARYEGRTTAVTSPCAGPFLCPQVTRANDHSTKPYLGIGAGYDFNDTFGVSANYDLYRADFGDPDVDTRALSIGVEARF